MKIHNREEARARIKLRIRKKLSGTAVRPRLCVFRSLSHIYAQVIDDDLGRTLVAASSLDEAFSRKRGQDKAAANAIGQLIAKRTLEKGISSVVFDRNGFKYHGRVKALADAAREAGLKF